MPLTPPFKIEILHFYFLLNWPIQRDLLAITTLPLEMVHKFFCLFHLCPHYPRPLVMLIFDICPTFEEEMIDDCKSPIQLDIVKRPTTNESKKKKPKKTI
jgi:hypothetical protein